MQIEIKSIEVDISEQLELIDTSAKVPFCILIDCEIGTTENEGSDNFRFSVCNALWLSECVKSSKKPVFLNELSLMVVDEFDLDMVKHELSSKLSTLLENEETPKQWRNIALRINQYANWEYFREETYK